MRRTNNPELKKLETLSVRYRNSCSLTQVSHSQKKTVDEDLILSILLYEVKNNQELKEPSNRKKEKRKGKEIRIIKEEKARQQQHWSLEKQGSKYDSSDKTVRPDTMVFSIWLPQDGNLMVAVSQKKPNNLWLH